MKEEEYQFSSPNDVSVAFVLKIHPHRLTLPNVLLTVRSDALSVWVEGRNVASIVAPKDERKARKPHNSRWSCVLPLHATTTTTTTTTTSTITTDTASVTPSQETCKEWRVWRNTQEVNSALSVGTGQQAFSIRSSEVRSTQHSAGSHLASSLKTPWKVSCDIAASRRTCGDSV
ncbi:hypothetical protein E2C01_000297 [Portunus trituberculatus]|uniref:Uncharacterized protein n=1 Tax=Portunus trituberculatus TaxID=210409 RepID=A0A5B7CDQ4_PORTR|nr:hypothetical protein [Portunus trituberculatus]